MDSYKEVNKMIKFVSSLNSKEKEIFLRLIETLEELKVKKQNWSKVNKGVI